MRNPLIYGICYFEGIWEPLMMSAASRQRCEQLLENFELPFPLTLDSLLEAVQKQHDRPIILHRDEFPPEVERPCGLWWRNEEGDHIWIAPEAAGSQEVHVLAHEVGHILFGHPPVKLTAPAEAPREEPTFRWLAPNFLGGDLIGVRTRAHSAHRDPEYIEKETEAEGFAARLRRKAAAQARNRHHDPLLNQLNNSI